MAPRPTRQQRGYDATHDRERQRWAPLVATGTIRCARCPELIHPDQPWHLDHADDRRSYLGPSHAHCNIAAAPRPTARRPDERHPGDI